jgi:aryl-alcohol dehydrogenase-like predicted oxidoreductase
MNFGPQTSEPDSFAIMDQALERGVNFFDTANRYGGDKGHGATEEIIGRWLKQGGRRERIVLATKVFGAMGEGQNDRGLSAYHIRKACEDSLRAVEITLSDEQMKRLDEIWPGPGGPAPEAYAW